MTSRHLFLALAALTSGCSRAAGPTGEPVDRMFDSSYEKFISSARAHKGGCQIQLTAKGDGGTRSDGVDSTVEVDDVGSFHLSLDGAFELVRVGSIAWQHQKGAKFAHVESGARPDLLRDDAIAGWRDVLRPLREHLTLARAETDELGERSIEVYTITAEPGGGADGGAQVTSGKGAVGLDAITGFPVAFEFEGSWDAPATPPAEGRVTWSTEKMECKVTELGGVPAITPAIATPTPTPAATAATATPAPSATATKPPKATPTPVPTAGRAKIKLKIK